MLCNPAVFANVREHCWPGMILLKLVELALDSPKPSVASEDGGDCVLPVQVVDSSRHGGAGGAAGEGCGAPGDRVPTPWHVWRCLCQR